MPANYSISSGMTDPGASVGGAAGTVGTAMPYLQLAMQLYQTLRGSDPGASMTGKFSDLARQRGLSFHDPNMPSELTKKRQAEEQVGTFALNAIPYAGPFLSAGASAHHASARAGAAQDYIQKILNANPELSSAGGTRLQPEFVPQTNYLANFASSQPKQLQGVFESKHGLLSSQRPESRPGIGQLMTGSPIKSTKDVLQSIPKPNYLYGKLGSTGKVLSKLDAVTGIGNKVLGAKDKQKEKEEEIHKQNVAKLRDVRATAQGQQQNEAVRRGTQRLIAGSQRGSVSQMLPLLLQLLQRRQGPPTPVGPVGPEGVINGGR